MPNIIVSSSIDQFMQSADSAAARSVLGLDIGTGAAQVASGNHTHVEFHDAATVSGNGVSITGQQISLDIGTGAAQVASGNHTHSSFVGDAGAGGLAGFVPAPASGDAAAGKYLDADGTWTIPIVSKSPFPTSQVSVSANVYPEIIITSTADEALIVLDVAAGDVTAQIGDVNASGTHYWIQAYSDTPNGVGEGDGYISLENPTGITFYGGLYGEPIAQNNLQGDLALQLVLGSTYHIYSPAPKVWRVLDASKGNADVGDP